MIDASRSGHYVGDCRKLLRQLPDGCVQTVITSPPFWGLRDYGTGQWEGGSDPSCDHVESKPSRVAASVATSTLVGSKTNVRSSPMLGELCVRCGAKRIDRQIGLEATPDLYVDVLVEVFREVRRVMKWDGTLWLNLGDSYAGSRSGPQGASGEMADRSVSKHRGMRSRTKGIDPKNPRVGPRDNAAPNRRRQQGLKHKDLVGIPWRTAFALRDDGWWLRQDIIWSKPNPLPESVTDRCTKAHEYIFLMSKAQDYYFDADAIAEPAVWRGQNRSDDGPMETAVPGAPPHRGLRMFDADPPDSRNKRSVWTVASQPYDGAHFATFPPRLIEPCVLAGSRPGDLVLDPFFGSGTTGMVAEKHGRRWIGFDLGYEQLAKERTAQRSLPMPPRDKQR